MDIQSGPKPWQVYVTFDSFQERWTFGSDLPTLRSLESLRWYAYVCRGPSYSDRPADYPMSVVMHLTTVSTALGNLVLSGSVPNQEVATAAQHMAGVIEAYLHGVH